MLAVFGYGLWLFLTGAPSPTGATDLLTVVGVGGSISLFLSFALLYGVYGGLLAGINAALTLGIDGVFIRRGLSRRFFQYADIKAVREESISPSYRVHVRLTLRSGKSFTFAAPPGTAQAIEGRLVDARALQQMPQDVAQALVSGRQEANQWLGKLRKLHESKDYRQGVVDADHLEQVVAHEGCSPVTRAAAAIALDGHDGSDNRRKLRIAADSYAEPKTRRLLADVAEAEAEAELAKELEALRKHEKRHRVRAPS